MKVIFVQVNRSDGADKTSCPHAGLGYLSAYSLNTGYETAVVDAKYEGIGNSEVISRIIRFKPDVLGLTMRTPDVKESEKVAAIMKKVNPLIKILVGGAHVNGVKERVLKECGFFDIGFFGEGEEAIVEVLSSLHCNSIKLKDIKGILYRDNDNTVLNPPREYIKNLDTLLFPAWHLFPRGSDLPLFTSRGCPFSCNFCQRVLGQRVRTMTPLRVIAEMQRNISELNCTFFQIEDEVFGLNKRWVDELLDLMIDNEIYKKAKWFANSRVNIASSIIYKKMKNAGCVGLGIGIESGNQRILDSIGKGIKLEQASNAIKIAKEAGLKVSAFFILGHPGESKKTIRDTINFACKLNPYDVAFGMMIPYPGTQIYEMAKRGEGGYKGFHENWELYTKYFGKGLELNGLSRSTLERFQKQAYIEFYVRTFRLKTMYNKIKLFFEMKRSVSAKI